MKKLSLNIASALLIAGSVSLVACSDFLDKQPSNELTEEKTFGSWEMFEYFHKDTYNFLRHGAMRVSGSWLDATTDLAETSMATGGARTSFNIGNYYSGGGWSELEDTWESRYRAIRKCNRVITSIDVVPQNPTQSVEEYEAAKRIMVAEARFFRAYFYWEMFLRFGPLPIVTEVLDPNDDMITPYSKRPTVKEYVVDFIIPELEAAGADMVDYATGATAAQSGRLCQPMAYAMLSRVKLYMASPRYASESGITWADAAAAAKYFQDNFGENYALYEDGINPDENYGNAVLLTQYTGNNREVIFFRNDVVIGWGGINTDVPVGEGGNGGNCPSQNLVDMYDMIDGSSPFAQYDVTGAPVYDANGKPTVNSASGYSDATMWQNRDPRLAATVLYQGQEWGTTRADSHINVIRGMADNPIGNANATPTGYYMRKYIPASILSSNHGGTAYRLWTIMRYAEILLNRAEALNEAEGPTAEVADLLDQVRHRAGITGNVADRADLMSSKEAMRNFIHKERTVEFAFEEHRSWDVRRWNCAVEALARPIYGVEVTRVGQSDGSANYDYTPGNYAITRKVAQQRVFEPHMYLYPIPEAEVWKTGLENNPGW